MSIYTDAGAEFSPDLIYRFRLWRAWGDGPRLLVIGLNPSVADATADDPTIRRCISFARRWGFAGLEMRNLFAYRATDPRVMLRGSSPRGDGNTRGYIDAARAVTDLGGAVLAAWGAHGRHQREGDLLACRLIDVGIGVACLGLTTAGQPRHPLYVAGNTRPLAYLGDGGRLVTDPYLPGIPVTVDDFSGVCGYLDREREMPDGWDHCGHPDVDVVAETETGERIGCCSSVCPLAYTLYPETHPEDLQELRRHFRDQEDYSDDLWVVPHTRWTGAAR